MLIPKYIDVINKWKNKLDLKDWTINIIQVEPHSICQIKNGASNYFCFQDTYAITYVLPTSKIAEIYLLPNKQNKEDLILHELLHLRTADWIFEKMYEIEKYSKTKEEARKKHEELREKEHKLMEQYKKSCLIEDRE